MIAVYRLYSTVTILLCTLALIMVHCCLPQHEAAAVNLVNLGAVEFLSQLRMHSDPGLHPLIDESLELLLKLPASAVVGAKTTLSGETSVFSHETKTSHLCSSNTTLPLPGVNADGEFLVNSCVV